MADDLSGLELEELQSRIEEVRGRMRPLEQGLAQLRAEREVLSTEVRRRERLATREARATVKAAMKEGELPSFAEFIASTESGAWEDHSYNLKTGGEVRLGFPGARAQTVSFSDGRQVAQARDLAESARLYLAGWELGGPGRPGVRVHFPGTRQERLVDPRELFVRQLRVAGGPQGI